MSVRMNSPFSISFAIVLVTVLGTSIAATSPPCCAQARGDGGAAPRPNIVFILVDSLRADRLGCYGDERGLTPVVDSLAKDGVLFERIIAPCSWTLPSVASYFTGLYPTAHPQRVEQMRRMLTRQLDRNEAILQEDTDRGVEISPEDRAHLRALGYLWGGPTDADDAEGNDQPDGSADAQQP